MTTTSNPAYRVETERFVARCWEPEDAPLVRAVLDVSDEHLRPWIPFMKEEPRSLADTAARIRTLRASFDSDEEYRFAMFEPGERSVLIGGTGLFKRVGPSAMEIGYWVGAPHNGRGFATEAAAAMVRLAFEVEKVDRVEIHCDAPNVASARIPAKLGFVHEATLARRALESTGQTFDLMIWTMFSDQYPGSPASKLPMTAFDCLGQRLL